MSQSGSGQSVSEDSTESQQSGPIASKPKPDFGKKHKKVVRILTVIAYIISVSTAAVLLSAYYVFLWKPEKSEKSTEATHTTMAMARTYQKLTSHHLSQQMSPYKYSSMGLPHYAQFVDVNNHHSHSNSKHAAHLKSRKSSSSPYSYFSQQEHLTHLLPPTPQSLIMQNILLSSTTPLTPVPHSSSSSTPTIIPVPTVPYLPTETSTKSPVDSTLASAFPSLSSSSSSSLSSASTSNAVMNIPKNGASTVRTSSHPPSSILPTNPTNSFTHPTRLLNSTLSVPDNSTTSTITVTVPTRSSSPHPDLESTEKIKSTKTTNDHHEEKVLSLRASTPSGRHSFPKRDIKLSDIGNPIIIMN